MAKHIMIIGSNSRSLVNFRGDLIKSLIKSGWQVTGAGPNLTKSIQTKLQEYGANYVDVPIDRSGMNPVKDLINFFRLTKILKKVQPSHVLTYTVKPNIWGTLAANRLGADSFAMVTGLGYAFTGTQNQSLKLKLVRFLSKTLYSFSTSKNKKVIFQNPDDRQDFIQYGCLKDASKTRIVNGSGVNMDYFRRVEMPDEPICLMIGRLHKNKGVREYCEAALLVKEKFPKARFLIVGYFDEGPDGINKLDMDKWVSQGVEFLGRKEDVRDVISMASIYVLPSYREGTPRSTLEAMSMGRPIITTDAPGCRETVIDAETGFIVPIRNVEALAEKMERLVSDRKLRSEMGQKSYDFCKEKYDVNSVNASLIEVLSE